MEWVAFPSPGHLSGLVIESTSTPIKMIKKKIQAEISLPCKRTRLRKMVSVWENGNLEATAPFLVPIGSQTQMVANTLEKNEHFRDGLSLHVFYPSCVVCYISSLSSQFFCFCIVVYTFFTIIFYSFNYFIPACLYLFHCLVSIKHKFHLTTAVLTCTIEPIYNV